MSDKDELMDSIRAGYEFRTKELERQLSTERAKLAALESLAYLGEHHFPNLTYKARLEELVPKCAEMETTLQERVAILEQRERVLIRASSLPAQQLAEVHIRNEQRLAKRIADLQGQLSKAKKVITDMPCHVWHSDGQEHLCAACQGRAAIGVTDK